VARPPDYRLEPVTSTADGPASPAGVNDAGQVLVGLGGGAFLWADGVRTSFGLLPGGRRSLNARGDVVGNLPGSTGGRGAPAVRRADGRTEPLATPAGVPPEAVTPLALSDAGTLVVGTVLHDGRYDGVLWRDGAVRSLDTLVPGGEWDVRQAVDVSPNGRFVLVWAGRGPDDTDWHTLLLDLGEPPLSVALEAAQLGDSDLLGVVVRTANAGPGPLEGLRLPSGTGVVAADGPGPGLTALAGPSPLFADRLAGGARSDHTVLLEVTRPGTTRLVTRASARDAGGTEHTAEAAVRVEAVQRPMTPLELDGAIAGSLALLQDHAAGLRARLLTRAVERLRGQLAKGGRRARALARPSALEKALAAQHGLPDAALSWLPPPTKDDFLRRAVRRRAETRLTPRRPSTTELMMLMYDEGSDTFVRQLLKRMDQVEEKVIRTPAAYFRDWWNDPQESARINHELAAMAREGRIKGGEYLAEAAKFYSSPAELQAAWEELPKLHAETQAKLTAAADDAELRILRWDQVVQDDPRKGMKQFAQFLGKVEADIAADWLENVLQDAPLKALGHFSDARKLAAAADRVPETPATQRLAQRPGTTIARNDAVARTPLPGLGNMTPRQLDFISDTLRRLGTKYGIDLELQIRPVNAYSAQIKGVIGKVEAIPTKNLTPDDLLMGAPPEWIGQTAYYRPVKPKGLDKLDAPDRRRIEQRYEEKLEEYKRFTGLLPDDPQGKAGKVKKLLKRGGAEVELGSNYKARIELDATHKGSATLIRYKKLEVDGRPIFDPKGGPRPIGSDFDINALIDAKTGRHLPAGIRGQAELELMDAFGKAQREGLLPFGFHGWTHSGFDLASKDFRHVAKYMLMYATDAQAQRFALRWAPRFFPELANLRRGDVRLRAAAAKLLEGYSRGKHLVKVTADRAVLGPGVDPNAGIPAPR
jgi:hypothetical protein